MLKASLSVFVPVHNGQAQIVSVISDLLEVLPDLNSQFELAIIDDGSTDATPEIAHELALQYPQMHVIVHPARWGQAAAMRSGLSHSSGDLVLLRNESCSLGAGCLPAMWQSMSAHDAALARATADAPLGMIPQLPGSQPSDFGWCLVRRRLLDAWRREMHDEDWLGYVIGHAKRIAELQIRPRDAAAILARGVRSKAGIHGRPPVSFGSGASQSAKRPNYLARLRAFALGE